MNVEHRTLLIPAETTLSTSADPNSTFSIGRSRLRSMFRLFSYDKKAKH